MGTLSTGNYTVGGISLFFSATVADASLLATIPGFSGKGSAFRTATLQHNLGNIVTSEITPDVTYLEHFVADKGRQKKNKISANMTNISIPFTFDEMSSTNLQRFFLASVVATTPGTKSLAVFEKALQEGSAQLYFNTDVGKDMIYFIPKCILRPDGALGGGDGSEWWSGPMVLDILHYDTSHWASKPYGFVYASVLTASAA